MGLHTACCTRAETYILAHQGSVSGPATAPCACPCPGRLALQRSARPHPVHKQALSSTISLLTYLLSLQAAFALVFMAHHLIKQESGMGSGEADLLLRTGARSLC